MTTDYPVTNRNRLRRRHERGHYDHDDRPRDPRCRDGVPHRLCHRRPAVLHANLILAGRQTALLARFIRQSNGTCAGEGHAGLPDSDASRCAGARAVGLPPLGQLPMRDGLWPGARGDRPSGQAAGDGCLHRSLLSRAARRRCGRPPQEIKAINILGMEIEDAAAKIRATGVADEEEDYATPVWCAVLPLRTVVGAPEECPRQLPGVTPTQGGMTGYRAGAPIRRGDAGKLPGGIPHLIEPAGIFGREAPTYPLSSKGPVRPLTAGKGSSCRVINSRSDRPCISCPTGWSATSRAAPTRSSGRCRTRAATSSTG